MTSSAQRKVGIILNYVQMSLHAIISIVYTPIMLRILGATEYGLYNLSSSIIAYLSLISLGFGASYLRFYSRYKKADNFDAIKRMNGLYLTVFTCMGLIALIAGLFLSSNVKVFLNDSYSNTDVKTASVLMLFLTINLSISFPASVFVSYITSQEKFVFQKLINMGKTILSPAVCIIFLFFGYGSIGMVMSTTIISIIIDLINIFYCFRYAKMEWGLLKEIAFFSFFIALNHIIDQINWQTDKVILGKMSTGTAVAIYAVGATVNNIFTQFSTAISTVFSPKINMIVAKKEPNMDEQLTSLLIKVGRLQWFVLTLILSGFIFFGQFFVYRWAGSDYGESYYVALLLMAPATVPLIQNVGIEIQAAKNKHQFRSIAYLIMAVVNVGISIFFCYLWGPIGAALGTTISLLLANGLIMNIYYHKKLGLNIVSFWGSIISTIPSLIAPIVFGIALTKFYTFHNLFDYIVFVIIYSIIFVLSVVLIGFNKSEKDSLRRLVKKVFKKKTSC